MQLRYGHFKSAALHGIDGIPIEIEVAILPGLPSFEIVGSGDSAIRESRNRIQAAIRTSGFQFPPSRVTASLAPAWLRKEGSAFDLPLALAILLASGQVCLHGSFGHSQPGAFGELGLDGQIRPVPGAFNRTAACRQAQVACLLVPSDSLNESLLAADASLCVNGADTLRECARILTCGFSERPPASGSLMPATGSQPPVPDLAGIKGQAKAVRALTVAAAGWHHLLLLGSPGSGKTALAATIPGILPPLTVEESLLVTQIHSAASQRIGLSGRIEKRPFLAPHTGVTRQTLTGGGNPPVPGLYSLAHLGVLFLDELTQLDYSILDSLRQPIEAHEIHLARMRYNLTLPADFLLVASANPCRCGEYFEPGQRCRCAPDAVARHLGKISGPLLDRLDLTVEVRRPAPEDMEKTVQCSSATDAALTSDKIRTQVTRAWEIQFERCRAAGRPAALNGRFQDPDLAFLLKIPGDVLNLAKVAAEQLRLSVRTYQKMLRVARTIADLEESESVRPVHLAEALNYRLSQLTEVHG